MPLDTSNALPIAGFVVLFAFLMYRRFRRLFGRQLVRPTRLKFRIAVLLVVGAMLLWHGRFGAQGGLAVAAGIGGGIALGLLGLRLTTFETTPQGRFYTPHGGIGLLLSILLLGRLAYRLVIVWPLMHDARIAGANPLAAFERSPLTLAIFALLIGYYATYCFGLLLRAGSDAKTIAR